VAVLAGFRIDIQFAEPCDREGEVERLRVLRRPVRGRDHFTLAQAFGKPLLESLGVLNLEEVVPGDAQLLIGAEDQPLDVGAVQHFHPVLARHDL
jgi:hypothetical protein